MHIKLLFCISNTHIALFGCAMALVIGRQPLNVEACVHPRPGHV